MSGIGSTRPEELREQRRRQLEIERNGVRAQLNLLATSHTRLETAIAQADAEAYRQSAAPVISGESQHGSGLTLPKTFLLTFTCTTYNGAYNRRTWIPSYN